MIHSGSLKARYPRVPEYRAFREPELITACLGPRDAIGLHNEG
ncbi:hypothetical protein ONO23_04957 [Micromonospora noduli]|nr:hypothetical protein ONO23_04957 [Micromonospora noduli]